MIGSTAAFECTRSIPENVYTLASRIEDADHGAEWLDSCVASNTVRDAGNPDGVPDRIDFEAYERLKGLPAAGISDRDVYLHGTWRREGADLVCRLSPSKVLQSAPPDGVVRMADLQGTFTLRPASQKDTSVTYALRVDLGGSVPDFIRDIAVREIPRKSLNNLAARAKGGPGNYEQYGRSLKAALDAFQQQP